MSEVTKSPVVSEKDVEKVAHLARLRLGQEELARFAVQLDQILHYVQQLQRVQTDRVEPTSHVLPLSNVTRPDRLHECVAPDEVLTMAPARHHQFFKVPKIVES